MGRFNNRRIVLGVTGSIAAYKALLVLQRLRRAGAQVAPVMTSSALRFVGALSFSSLAGRATTNDLWSPAEAGQIGHVELAHWAEAVVIAPASADCLARLALGRADDALSALALATSAPLVVAPAMEDGMWRHPATQSHVNTLRQRGVIIVEPETGALASGRRGNGRLAKPRNIVESTLRALSERRLDGVDVLVTAGPTREYLDPVRFLSNPSSGRMGIALAAAAAREGARVTLVSGPVELQTPMGVNRVDVISTQEMLEACGRHITASEVLLMAAAPADLRPTSKSHHKLKKGGLTDLNLEGTPDILRTLKARTSERIVIGFAAETTDLERHALEKLKKKDLDAIVANRVRGSDEGFATRMNRGVLYGRSGETVALPWEPKTRMACRILRWVIELRQAREEQLLNNRHAMDKLGGDSVEAFTKHQARTQGE